MTENAENLSTAETLLRNLLANMAAAQAGTLARAHGWPQPNEAQVTDMTRTMLRALTALVVGMRHPDALPASMEEIQAVIEGVSLGVLEKTMGLPTPEVVH